MGEREEEWEEGKEGPRMEGREGACPSNSLPEIMNPGISKVFRSDT